MAGPSGATRATAFFSTEFLDETSRPSGFVPPYAATLIQGDDSLDGPRTPAARSAGAPADVTVRAQPRRAGVRDDGSLRAAHLARAARAAAADPDVGGGRDDRLAGGRPPADPPAPPPPARCRRVCSRRGDRHRRRRGEQDRPHPVVRGLEHRVPGRHALGPELVDLAHQDHRVADDDADEREHAEDGHEPHRLVEQQQGRHDADQPERRHREDEQQPAEVLELDHQEQRHGEQHHRHHGRDRPWPLADSSTAPPVARV